MADNVIEVKKLSKKFGKFTAVDAVDFEIKKGEIFGLLGPNGAGKSTIIRMLVTLARPTSGSATLAGFDVVKNQDEVRRHLGLVAEKIILYPNLTAWENLKFFGKLYHLSEEQIIKRAERWIHKLKMTEWMNVRISSFSTGMKQRINIVRALLTEPEVLFLDEPTLGLDPQTNHMIREFIRELNNQGITVLLTTHDMIEADALCDQVAIIDHGKIAALDTAANLKKCVIGKNHPTLEDVFLEITGKEIRDKTVSPTKASGGPGHHFGGGNNNRVR